METTGAIRAGNERVAVTGLSWMDHEFSTSFLEPGQQGWDWFSLQLDNGRELMIYRIRRADGSADPFSAGTMVDVDGRPTTLKADDFKLVPGRTWKSPVTGAVYPVAWQVRLPNEAIELAVEAAFESQELDTRATTGLAYWEGSVATRGTWGDRPVTGRGYLEMTGYAGRALGGSLEGTEP
jgi:predicted secreted hydrolase